MISPIDSYQSDMNRYSYMAGVLQQFYSNLHRTQPVALNRQGVDKVEAGSRVNHAGAARPNAAASMRRSAQTGILWEQNDALSLLLHRAQALQQVYQPLNPNETHNVWNATMATSSSPELAATSYHGTSQADYAVDVHRLAAAQRNEGRLLSSAAVTGLSAGTHQFELTVKGVTRHLIVTISGRDTESDVLNKIAEVINDPPDNIYAFVRSNLVDNTSQLMVRSTESGTHTAFRLADVSGNAVQYTGIGTTAVEATDAAYRINGESYTHFGNQVTLQNGNVRLSLLGTVTGAEVKITPDHELMVEGINQFVSAYNDTLGFLSQKSAYLNAQFTQVLHAAYQQNADELKQLGISQNHTGSLIVNQATLTTATQSNFNRVLQAVAGPMGLAAVVQEAAQMVAASPMSAQVVHPIQRPFRSSSLVRQPLDANDIVGRLLDRLK